MANIYLKRFYIYAAATLSMVFWGLSFIWTSTVFEYYSPIATIFLRLVLSSTFLFLVLWLSGYLRIIQKKHWLILITSAVFNPFLYFIGENYGLKYSTPSITAIVVATIPVLTPLAAWLMIREKIPWFNILGIFISFGGILVLIINPDLSLTTDPRGIFILMVAVFAAIVYSIFLKQLTIYYDPVNIIAWQNLIGVMLFFPLFLFLDLDEVMSIDLDARLVFSMLSLAVFASSLAFILFAYAIKHLGVSRANVYGNLIPVITAIASYYFLDEVFTEKKISGIIIVIGGVMLSQIRRGKKTLYK